MPTSCELTSTDARRNAVPQVINLARKGKPSPSAGGRNTHATMSVLAVRRRQNSPTAPSQRARSAC
eukprot:scaffold43945_cov24-Phaeocystis_antarctica.AAC.1